jgi:CDP-diacylglycerol---glycerol-3-phosphate 3-phosphatidyltransferase
MNVANAFTLLRVFLVPVIAALLLLGGEPARWWACGVFVFAAATDTLDGWVARRTAVSRWGQLMDPLADKLLILGTMAVLTWRGDVAWWVLAVVALREVAVTWLRDALARRDVVMPASIFGKAKTVLQVLAITLLLAPPVPRGVADVVLWLAVVATLASGLEYVGRARRLTGEG